MRASNPLHLLGLVVSLGTGTPDETSLPLLPLPPPSNKPPRTIRLLLNDHDHCEYCWPRVHHHHPRRHYSSLRRCYPLSSALALSTFPAKRLLADLKQYVDHPSKSCVQQHHRQPPSHPTPPGQATTGQLSPSSATASRGLGIVWWVTCSGGQAIAAATRGGIHLVVTSCAEEPAPEACRWPKPPTHPLKQHRLSPSSRLNIFLSWQVAVKTSPSS